MATSEQLEREAEATRAQIAATLDELRSRLTPGQVVDQLVDYARDSGGGEFVRNLGQQVVANPLPITLVGAGLAWLMMAGRRTAADGGGNGLGNGQDFRAADAAVGARAGAAAQSLGDVAQATRDSASDTAADPADSARRQSHDWADSARSTAEGLNQRLGEVGAGLQESANAAGSAMRDAASTAYDSASNAASNAYDAAAERSRQGADVFARGARSMRDNAAAGGRNVVEFLQEQPLVLAGIGLAVGAMLGASLPSTDVEDKMMGDASDAAKHDAKAFVEEQADKGKAVAEQAWNAAKPELEEQLHANEQHAGAAASDASARHEHGGEAPLVPSDESRQGEMTADAARREPSSE